MDDGDGIEDTFGPAGAGEGGDDSGGGHQSHQYSRSFSPSNLQLPVDFISTQRLDRESSLEAIPHPSGSVVFSCTCTCTCMYTCMSERICYMYMIMIVLFFFV